MNLAIQYSAVYLIVRTRDCVTQHEHIWCCSRTSNRIASGHVLHPFAWNKLIPLQLQRPPSFLNIDLVNFETLPMQDEGDIVPNWWDGIWKLFMELEWVSQDRLDLNSTRIYIVHQLRVTETTEPRTYSITKGIVNCTFATCSLLHLAHSR